MKILPCFMPQPLHEGHTDCSVTTGQVMQLINERMLGDQGLLVAQDAEMGKK